MVSAATPSDCGEVFLERRKAADASDVRESHLRPELQAIAAPTPRQTGCSQHVVNVAHPSAREMQRLRILVPF